MKTAYKMTLVKTLKKALLAFALVLFAGQIGLKAQTVADAERLVDRGEYTAALKMIDQLLLSDPKDEKLWYQKGRAYFELEDFTAAKSAFNKGLALGARYAFNYVGLGAVLVKEGNLTEAKTNLDKAKELNRNADIKIMVGIAEAWLNSSKPEALQEAETMLYKVLTLDKANGDAYVGLGDLYDRQKVNELALENYTKATELNPKFIKGYLRVGQIQKKMKLYNEAATAFNKAIEIDPTFPPPHREMAEMWILAGKFDNAVASYDKYLALVNNDKAARVRYGAILYASQKYELGIQKMEEVLKDTQAVILYRLLGYSHAELKNWDLATSNLKIYFEKANAKAHIPSDYEYMGKIYAATGKDSLAVIEYKKAMELATKLETPKPELWGTIAEIYKAAKKYSQEAQSWESLIQATKVTMKDLFAEGRAWYNAANYPKADSCFTEMTKLKADFHAGWLWKGRATAKMDTEKKGLAKPYYEEALKLIEASEENKTKYKNDYLECLGYMGAYYTLQSDKAQVALGVPFWEKMLVIEPGNKQATEGLAYCKKLIGQ